jgi:hypothetical protein
MTMTEKQTIAALRKIIAADGVEAVLGRIAYIVDSGDADTDRIIANLIFASAEAINTIIAKTYRK